MNLYFIGHGIVLKGIVKYYGSGKNIPHTFGHTAPLHPPLLLYSHFPLLGIYLSAISE